jgi:hypothetical protein
VNTDHRRAIEWMIQHSLCAPESPILKINVGRLQALCTPYCRSNEQLELATCLNYSLFAWDDKALNLTWTTIGMPSLAGRLAAVLDAPEATYADPFQRAMADLIHRYTATVSAHNLAHLISGFYQYLLDSVWQASNLVHDPTGIDPTPLDLPTTRWWWDQLT